jgi:NAD(P)-dependent dehydrogenase (short-subunit alcohol dehydrogenase family)
VLAGKRILVTGGGTGLGKELARQFAAHGASVHICGRRETVLQQTVAELQATAQHGGSIEHHICDVRDAEQIEAMVERIWTGGPLTGLINNAAANFISPSVDITALPPCVPR